MIDSKRRGFFTSFSKLLKDKDEKRLIRPPYNVDVSLFDRCLECEGFCLDACEENIIELLDGKPILNFVNSGCTYCRECADVCEFKVLDFELELEREFLIEAKFKIDDSCLAKNGTICCSCRDVCDVSAITFEGMFNPKIESSCINCGFCFGICPTKSIEVS